MTFFTAVPVTESASPIKPEAGQVAFTHTSKSQVDEIAATGRLQGKQETEEKIRSR